MPTQRERILDAAIELLGSRGPRGLTHRAADAAAGVPAGSTSNHFRTREALLCGVTEHLEQLDHREWAGADPAVAADPDRLAAALAAFVVRAATTDRPRTLARYALYTEARTLPAVRAGLDRGHRRLRERAAELAAGVGLGPADARIVVDYLDGAVLHRLTGAESDGIEDDPGPGIRRLIDALRPGPPR